MPRLWTVPPEAMAALEQAAKERFEKQMCARLAKEFPQKAAGAQAMVRQGIADALSYGFTGEAEMERFLRLYFEADFDIAARRPAAAAVLSDPEIDGAWKLELIEHP